MIKESIRHIGLSGTVETQKTAGSGNPPQIYFPVGAVTIPKNYKFEIKNFAINVSDLDLVGSGNTFDDFVLYHRFFICKDPIRTLIDNLPANYSLLFNGISYVDNSFQRNDLKDSSGSLYNQVLIKNNDAGTHTDLHLLNAYTNTIHETIPFSLNNKNFQIKDFYFESRYDDILAFCIFPYITFNVPSGSLVLAFDYSINFDLIQKDFI